MMMSVLYLCLYIVEDVLSGVDMVMPGGYQTLINLVKEGVDDIRTCNPNTNPNRSAQAGCRPPYISEMWFVSFLFSNSNALLSVLSDCQPKVGRVRFCHCIAIPLYCVCRFNCQVNHSG